MTLISTLVNKFLILIGATDVAATESASSNVFGLLAILLIACGVITIVKKKPLLVKYAEYTPGSVAAASPLLGIGDIILGILDAFIGVLDMNTIPNVIIYAGAGLSLAAYIAVMTFAIKKFVKK